MFDYTQTAIKKIASDFKRLGFLISLTTQLLMIAYFCYAICAGIGNSIANVILAVLSAAYFVFFIVTRNMSGKNEKKMKKLTKRALKYSKLFIKTMTLGGLIYGAIIASGNITVVDIVLIGLSIIGWVIQILFEAVVFCVEAEVDMLTVAIKMDIEVIKKPVTAVGDAIKKLTGRPVEEKAPEKPEKRAKLDKLKMLFKSQRDTKKEPNPQTIQKNEPMLLPQAEENELHKTEEPANK